MDHWFGVGQGAIAKLAENGFATWTDVAANPQSLPFRPKFNAHLQAEAQSHLEALQHNRISFFTERFHNRNKGLLLKKYLSKAAFFDCETTGLAASAKITVIALLYQGELQTFVKGQNLDDFCDLLPSLPLVVTFSGSHFDIPHVLRAFHIPSLPCPHIDARWVAYHAGYRGGLKAIEAQMGFERPDKLKEVDGQEAIQLWNQYQYGDERSLQTLLDYVRWDVKGLEFISQQLAGHRPKSLH